MPRNGSLSNINTPFDLLTSGFSMLERVASMGRFSVKSGSSTLMSSLRLQAYRKGGSGHGGGKVGKALARGTMPKMSAGKAPKMPKAVMPSASSSFPHSGKPLTSGPIRRMSIAMAADPNVSTSHVRAAMGAKSLRGRKTKSIMGFHAYPLTAKFTSMQKGSRYASSISGYKGIRAGGLAKVGASPSIKKAVKKAAVHRSLAKHAKAASRGRKAAAVKSKHPYVQTYKRRDKRTGKMLTVRNGRWVK